MRALLPLVLPLVLALCMVLSGSASASRNAAARAGQEGTAGDGTHIVGPVAADVLRVVDGDTLTVRAHIWIGHAVETSVRLTGIDTPELRARCAEEREKAREAREFLRRLVGDDPVMLSDIQSDKYGGRVLARVRNAAGADLAQALMRAGLARPYKGDRRLAWCAG